MIKNALKEANCDPEDEEAQPINSAGDGEQWSAARIIEQMEFIGDQITSVSTKHNNLKFKNISHFLTGITASSCLCLNAKYFNY